MSRGHASTAAVESLQGIGPQDIYLSSSDEKDSLWDPAYKRHTDFAAYQRAYRLQGPFINSTVKEVLKTQTMGDMISNAWLKCTLPKIPVDPADQFISVTFNFTSSGSVDMSSVLSSNPSYTVSNVNMTTQVSGGGFGNVIIGDVSSTEIFNVTIVNGASASSNIVYSVGELESTLVPDNATFQDSDSNVLFSNIQTSIGTSDTANITVNLELDTPVYVDQIGRAIIKEVRLRIGNEVLQVLDTDWYSIRDQLFNNYEQRQGLKYMINGGQDYGQLPLNPSVANGPIDLFVPLDLFFSHRGNYTAADARKPFFPICACHNQEVEISIEFNNITYFCRLDTIYRDIGKTPPTLELENVELVLEMIDLTPEEQNFWRNGSYTLRIPRIIKQPRQVFTLGDDSLSVVFIPEGLVKSMMWFFRSTLFEDPNDDTYYLQRFNFSTALTTNVQTQDEFNPLVNATFYFDGTDAKNFGVSHQYYKYLQPIEYDSNPPETNVYMKSFALRPLSSISSGNIDLSDKGGKALVKFATGAKPGSSPVLINSQYSVNMYHYAEAYLKGDKGQLTPLYVRD